MGAGAGAREAGAVRRGAVARAAAGWEDAGEAGWAGAGARGGALGSLAGQGEGAVEAAGAAGQELPAGAAAVEVAETPKSRMACPAGRRPRPEPEAVSGWAPHPGSSAHMSQRRKESIKKNS